MTDNNDSSDGQQSYQLPVSRRNLLRAGGAAAGVGAAGGIPAATSIDSPVGEAEAVAPLIAIGAAGIVGLSGVGVGLYLGGDGSKLDSEKVVDKADAQSIYNAAESAILSQKSAVKTIVADLGVGKNDSGSVKWLNKQSNAHRSQLIEHATAETALAWDAGKTRSQAVLAGRNGARQVSVTAQISLINIWNDLIAALSKSIKRDIEGGHGVMTHGKYEDKVSGWAPVSSDTDYDPVVNVYNDMSVDGPWDSPAAISSISYDRYLPSPEEYLSSENIPSEWSLLTLHVHETNDQGYVSDRSIVAPIEAFGDVAPSGNANVFYNGSEKNNLDDGYYTTQEGEIKASVDGFTATIDVAWYGVAHDAIMTMRSNVVQNIDSYCQTVYDSLESGDITVQDIVSARQLYQDLQPSEDVSRQSVTLAAGGATGAVDDKVTVSTASQTITGIPFVESESTIDLSPGTSVAAGDYQRLHIIKDDGSRQTLEGVDFSVESVNGSSDPEGDENLSFEPPADTGGDPTGVTEEEVKQIVKDDQERYDELEKQIEELENDGPLGIGGIGGGENGILIAGGVAVAAYLLGR